jgi:uncharacterized membrane protein YhaH (DUF805 family)
MLPTAQQLPTVQQLPGLVLQLADPRGRCNRQGFLNIALAFLALQSAVWVLFKIVGIELSESSAFILNAPILWIGTAVCAKRLHDLGRKGWLIPVAIVGWIIAALVFSFIMALVFGPEALLPGTIVYAVIFTAIFVPALGALLWLHTTNGMPTENAYGPVPTMFGLSVPANQTIGYADGAVAA